MAYFFFGGGGVRFKRFDLSWIHALQEYTIKRQLDCGVRYCDLRIARRPNDSSTDLYFYHGVYTTLTVEVGEATRRCKLLHSLSVICGAGL